MIISNGNNLLINLWGENQTRISRIIISAEMAIPLDLGVAQPGLCKVRGPAGFRDGKKGQVGISGHVGHSA